MLINSSTSCYIECPTVCNALINTQVKWQVNWPRTRANNFTNYNIICQLIDHKKSNDTENKYSQCRQMHITVVLSCITTRTHLIVLQLFIQNTNVEAQEKLMWIMFSKTSDFHSHKSIKTKYRWTISMCNRSPWTVVKLWHVAIYMYFAFCQGAIVIKNSEMWDMILAAQQNLS